MKPVLCFRVSLTIALLLVATCGADDHSTLSPATVDDLTLTLNDNDIAPSGQPTSQPGSLIKMLLSPVRATLDTAKRILGLPIGNLSSGMDAIRVQTFKVFMRLYNKTYSPEEIPRRMALFFNRRKEIEESVRAFREGKALFAMRENAFLDWDDGELKKLTGVTMPKRDEMEAEELDAALLVTDPKMEQPAGADGQIREQTLNHEDFEPVVGNGLDWNNLTVRSNIPTSKDWRESGCVGAPLDQQQCGACYAIATMNTVETMRCLKSGSGPVLSSQQIVDCARASAGYRNYGCDGGWPTPVLKYLQDVGVSARETCYPFVRKQNSCKLPTVQSKGRCTVSASPTNSPRVQYKVLNNERDILYHVANTGPVVTVMKTTNKFIYYSSGIFDDPRCSRKRDDVDHAISIVGYGRENGVDYWIIKNSWGQTTWGQGGFGLYRRGTNACSIGHWGWVVTN